MAQFPGKPGNRGGPMSKPRKAGMTRQGYNAVASKKGARTIKHDQHRIARCYCNGYKTYHHLKSNKAHTMGQRGCAYA